tara:strand:- start:1691 stop:1918 length:228 start_codon:yes stop_codon:yes gene_type:complete
VLVLQPSRKSVETPKGTQNRNLPVSGSHTAKAQADLPFRKRSHDLDRTTLREPIVSAFQHHTIMAHLALTSRPAG